MTGSVSPGCIVHWEDFEFSDGACADKFLVVVGCKPGSNYLAVLGTSKRHRRSFVAGCNHKDGYYHMPGKRAWFPLDTWLVLADPIEITPADFLRRAMVEKTLKVCGQLKPDIANAVRNCLKLCPDVSAQQIALL